MATGAHVPSGFFVLRTPLLPYDAFAALGEGLGATGAFAEGTDLGAALAADRDTVLGRMRRLVETAEIRETLFVASPSLDDALAAWLVDPSTPRAEDVPQSLVRYLTRMAARPTPFGLFSGCSVGKIGGATHLELGARADYRRHTRLDTHYLAALCEAMHGNPDVRGALAYFPSTGLYAAAGQLRYAEARTDPKSRARSYHLVSVERTEPLDATLARAARGARPAELVSALVDSDGEIERADAEAFVSSLIDSQILVSELAPSITGDEPLAAIVDVLGRSEAFAAARAILEEAAHAIGELDAAGLGCAPARYRGIATSLRALPGEPELARLFQVDLYKPAPAATLGGEPLREIERALELLARIAPRAENDALRRFREAFAERYGERTEGPLVERQMVPLAEVLDEEAGIGFGESADALPLLDGLELPPDPSSPQVPFGPREERLLRGLAETARLGRRDWALDESDLAALETKNAPSLPDAFAVMTTLAARSEEACKGGAFRLVTPAVSGPSGAVLLGRFCHGNAALRQAVEAHLRAEEALRPEAVFAEIVHLPEGRLGNILCRPVLRAYEIPFHGRPGVPAERQLAIGDLDVTIANGRVVLWSRRLGREVLPRLTSAHNYAREALGVYRFLCALQAEREGRGLAWSWGPLANAPFLPRVISGRIVLSLARWSLVKEEIAQIAKATGADRYRAVQALRARREIPRWVAVADFDNVLPIDLDNVVSVESFVRLVKGRDAAGLQEVFPGEEDLIVTGPEGRFVHELVVPFVRAARAAESADGSREDKPTPSAFSRTTTPIARSFPPGSEWLYAKIYTGTAGADAVLTEIVAPLVRAARKAKAIERWFFIRYGDPHWHVRVRFRGEPKRLAAKVLPMLRERTAPPLASGRVWRVDLATYEREIERYGSDAGIELAEDLFEADSEAVLSIIELLDADEGADARWRLALRGCHLLLTDLGFGLEARTAVVRRARAAFGAEHGVDKAFEGQLGSRFRAERASLETLLAAPIGTDHPFDPGFEALGVRTERLFPIAQELRLRGEGGRLNAPVSALAASYLHMHCNRLLSAGQRAQELVLYDWLLRLYESEAARARVRRK